MQALDINDFLFAFIQCLRDICLYESKEEAVLREEVLGRLDSLAKEWVQRVSALFGMGGVGDAEAANAKIFTFGSYRLGVHGPGRSLFPNHVIPVLKLNKFPCSVALSTSLQVQCYDRG